MRPSLRFLALIIAATETRSLWVDDSSYYVSLPGPKRPHGYLIFRSKVALSDEERGELGKIRNGQFAMAQFPLKSRKNKWQVIDVLPEPLHFLALIVDPQQARRRPNVKAGNTSIAMSANGILFGVIKSRTLPFQWDA